MHNGHFKSSRIQWGATFPLCPQYTPLAPGHPVPCPPFTDPLEDGLYRQYHPGLCAFWSLAGFLGRQAQETSEQREKMQVFLPCFTPSFDTIMSARCFPLVVVSSMVQTLPGAQVSPCFPLVPSELRMVRSSPTLVSGCCSNSRSFSQPAQTCQHLRVSSIKLLSRNSYRTWMATHWNKSWFYAYATCHRGWPCSGLKADGCFNITTRGLHNCHKRQMV